MIGKTWVCPAPKSRTTAVDSVDWWCVMAVMCTICAVALTFGMVFMERTHSVLVYCLSSIYVLLAVVWYLYFKTR